jgi:hypothetical protein
MTAVLVSHPATSRHVFRAQVCRLVDRLITMLDEIDGDPDLEDGADGEPSLSFALSIDQDQAIRLEPMGDIRFLDLEDACEDEGAEHDGREPELAY